MTGTVRVPSMSKTTPLIRGLVPSTAEDIDENVRAKEDEENEKRVGEKSDLEMKLTSGIFVIYE